MLVQSASIRGTEIKWKPFITIKQENLSFIDMAKHHVGAENDQHINTCSFAVRCDRMWHSSQ